MRRLQLDSTSNHRSRRQARWPRWPPPQPQVKVKIIFLLCFQIRPNSRFENHQISQEGRGDAFSLQGNFCLITKKLLYHITLVILQGNFCLITKKLLYHITLVTFVSSRRSYLSYYFGNFCLITKKLLYHITLVILQGNFCLNALKSLYSNHAFLLRRLTFFDDKICRPPTRQNILFCSC